MASIQITLIASARIPMTLYLEAVEITGREGGPSWGQLVAWTCEDHKADVIRQLGIEATPVERVPRGRPAPRKQLQPIAARMTEPEAECFNRVKIAASEALVETPSNARIVEAALRVAVRQSQDL